MKLLVAIKPVADPAVTAWPAPPDTRWVINPFDAVALEQAVQWREQGRVDQVVTVTIGHPAGEEILRTTLALGAERAVWLAGDEQASPLARARQLAALAVHEQAALVLMGRQGVDEDLGQTGPMLAALLDWAQATGVAGMTWQDATTLLADREVDGGIERLSLPLPAVITVALQLTTPRYVSLPNMLKAKAKPLVRMDLARTVAPDGLQVMDLQPAPIRPAKKIRLASVAHLAHILQSGSPDRAG